LSSLGHDVPGADEQAREAACRFLSSQGWLARTPPVIRDAVLKRCTLCDVAPDERVCEIGKPPSGIWGVVSGGFALEFATDEQGPHFAHIFRPGTWFGECEVFEQRAQFVTVVATRPSRCLRLSPVALDAVARDHPLLWRYVAILAGAHVADALGALSDSTIRETDARLAAILLRLAGVRLHEQLSDPEPELDLTQNDLALLANVSRATIHETLTRMESAGLIARSYGHLRILDTAGLRALIS
jgi:CRP/FNR family cyclic AMP-dependent transcriptional regulator